MFRLERSRATGRPDGSVAAAECLIPEEGYPLNVLEDGPSRLVSLPPYTWGTVVRLRTEG